MTEQQLGQWIAALESGQYTQVQGSLEDIFIDGRKGNCCLGVLSRLHGFITEGTFSGLSYPDSLVLPTKQNVLVHLNDGGSIDQYARVIADLKGAPEHYITEAPPLPIHKPTKRQGNTVYQSRYANYGQGA